MRKVTQEGVLYCTYTLLRQMHSICLCRRKSNGRKGRDIGRKHQVMGHKLATSTHNQFRVYTNKILLYGAGGERAYLLLTRKTSGQLVFSQKVAKWG